jgi:quercetin dioxygenase-like cupin family protein
MECGDEDDSMEPVIRNEHGNSNPLLGRADGVSNYVMLYVKHGPGESSADHTHAWEHQAFITEGSGILVCGGKEYPIKTGDAILVPAGIRHQFRNTGNVPMNRVTVNPIESIPSEDN